MGIHQWGSSYAHFPRSSTAAHAFFNGLLAAICDPDPKVLAAHAERFQVPAYQSYQHMLNAEALDLVALCTPSGLHSEQRCPVVLAKVAMNCAA